MSLESHLPNVRRLLVRNLRRIGVPAEEAEDIAQGALLKLARCRATDDVGIAAYATEIGKRMWFRSGERARHSEVCIRDWRVHESLVPVPPEERLDAREMLFQWKAFATTLPANVRVAAEACFIDAVTYAELGKRFEVPVSTVHGWLQSARAGFRDWLESRHGFARRRKRAQGGMRRTK